MISIEKYKDEYKQDMIDMILSIENGENHLDLTLQEQPDLYDVESSFFANGGMFWMAFEDNKLIGTIGLAKKNSTVGVLKKFFIKKDKRGTSLSMELYSRLVLFAEKEGIKKIILDTPSVATRAHHFYEKAGFKRVSKEELPVCYEYPDRNCYLYMLDLEKTK